MSMNGHVCFVAVVNEFLSSEAGMKTNVSICPTCGHRITEYKHSINKTLVSCLHRLNAVGGRARLDTMGLNNTQFANFQKLRYFGFAVPTQTNNEWQITEQGVWFLQGRIQVHQFVITKNANVIRESSQLVYINQIKECVQYKIQCQDQARQPNLFD